ncbi:hypothetical protein LENED_000774 [Lentinula edodes]|uniref:Uncharacterized protein n=1 Tax=Lentinula edodes TaxID=5353 RepID=A0A1Q3DX69_LENED|nr:hypothetical protein LENED_000774 [Lentinula edodes]
MFADGRYDIEISVFFWPRFRISILLRSVAFSCLITKQKLNKPPRYLIMIRGICEEHGKFQLLGGCNSNLSIHLVLHENDATLTSRPYEASSLCFQGIGG